MLFKNKFKPKSYQKVFGVGYYTPNGAWTTIQTRCGKQSAISSLKIPTAIFDKLDLDETDNSIRNLAEFPELTVVKDEETGFRKLEYHPTAKKSETTTDDSED